MIYSIHHNPVNPNTQKTPDSQSGNNNPTAQRRQIRWKWYRKRYKYWNIALEAISNCVEMVVVPIETAAQFMFPPFLIDGLVVSQVTTSQKNSETKQRNS